VTLTFDLGVTSRPRRLHYERHIP